MAQLRKLEVKHGHASTISPNKYNPNKQDPKDFELLIRSMAEDGFTQPIVVQAATMEIVDGEHRWTGMIVMHFLNKHWPLPERGRGVMWPTDLINEARKKRREILAGQIQIETAGYEGTYEGIDPKIAYVPVDFTAEQMKIATLRHNRARGTEDVELLAGVLADLEALGVGDWAKTSLKLDDEDFERMVAGATASAPAALAGGEFSQAWEPDVVGDEIKPTEETQVMQGAVATPVAVAASAKAVQTLKIRDAALAAAKTTAERDVIKKQHAIFKLTAVFDGDDAALVRGILGDKPAEKLVQLCSARYQAPATEGAN